jgi:predicted lipid carrier protein YhbT
MNTSIAREIASRMPRALAALPGIRKLPWPGPLKYLPETAQLFAAQQLSNRLLKQQLDDGELDFLEGVTLRVRIRDMGFDWGITRHGAGLRFKRGDDTAETTFSGDSREFLLLASRREDPDTLFFQRRLSIEGDTEMGLQVKNLIDSIDMDEMPAAVNRVLNMSADFVDCLNPGSSAPRTAQQGR